MNDYGCFPELVSALRDAGSRQDPLVRIVELVGEWVLEVRSFDDALTMLEISFLPRRAKRQRRIRRPRAQGSRASP